MSFEGFDFQTIPDLPEPCNGCAVQCELHSELARSLFAKHMSERAADRLVGEPGEAFDAMLDEHVPEELADFVKQASRQMVATSMEDVDAHIADTQQTIDANARSCAGVLRMRATKGDVTYTVNVCTSPLQYVRDGSPKHMPVHIKADSANKY